MHKRAVHRIIFEVLHVKSRRNDLFCKHTVVHYSFANKYANKQIVSKQLMFGQMLHGRMYLNNWIQNFKEYVMINETLINGDNDKIVQNQFSSLIFVSHATS